MIARLVALDDASDILIDRAMIVVGRHPGCDSRLDSLRISRHHCCMTPGKGDLWVRDLGSTNGIRINGRRVESGRLRSGDELSVAHFRYRLENASSLDRDMLEDSLGVRLTDGDPEASETGPSDFLRGVDRGVLADAVRQALPPELAGRCRIDVVLHELEVAAPETPCRVIDADLGEFARRVD